MRHYLLPFCCVLSFPLFAIEVPPAAHIIVNGVAEKKVEPDMVLVTLQASAMEKQGINAKKKVDNNVAAFFNKLESLSIKRSDIDAGNILLSPEYLYSENKRPELIGYRAQRQLTVKYYQLDKLSQLIDTALQAGLDSVNQVEYGLKNTQLVKDEVRLMATEDAKSKAQALAAGFNAKVGKVYSIEYRTNPPVAGYVPVMKMMASPSYEDKNNGHYQQQIIISDTMDVVFLLE